MNAREGDALEVLHHHVEAVVFDTDLVRLDDVRVVEPRGEAGLLEEHLRQRTVASKLRLQLLDDEELAEPGRTTGGGKADHAHTAARDLGNQLVSA